LFSVLAEAHADLWHRYPKAEGLPWFYTIEQFIPIARELLNSVSMEVRGAPLERTDPA
jgi:hypothetical protein